MGLSKHLKRTSSAFVHEDSRLELSFLYTLDPTHAFTPMSATQVRNDFRLGRILCSSVYRGLSGVRRMWLLGRRGVGKRAHPMLSTTAEAHPSRTLICTELLWHYLYSRLTLVNRLKNRGRVCYFLKYTESGEESNGQEA